MKAAGKLVVLVGKLCAGMQFGQDQFHPRNTLIGVHVHRHAPAIIADFHRAVCIGNNIHLPRMTGQRFVNTVVNNFRCKVIGPGRIGVHTRPALDRFQPGQHLDVFCLVLLTHFQNEIPAVTVTAAIPARLTSVTKNLYRKPSVGRMAGATPRPLSGILSSYGSL